MKSQLKVVELIQSAELDNGAPPGDVVLYEQLALRRLRQLLWQGWWNQLKHQALLALDWFLSKPELVREVGPGRRPLSRHEWEPQGNHHRLIG